MGFGMDSMEAAISNGGRIFSSHQIEYPTGWKTIHYYIKHSFLCFSFQIVLLSLNKYYYTLIQCQLQGKRGERIIFIDKRITAIPYKIAFSEKKNPSLYAVRGF